jgi:hypothetical protein
VFLLSGRNGTDDGCIGGPGLIVDLPEPVSCCDGVEGLLSDAFGVGLNGSLSLEEGTGVVLLCLDLLSFDSRTGTCWVPFLEDADQSHC